MSADAATHICVSIPVDHCTDVGAALQALERACQDGATMVEWRVDSLAEEQDALSCIRSLVRQSKVPSIVTIRGAREGGHYKGTDADRVSLLEAIGTGEDAPAYIDFELADFEASANLRQKLLLAVQHAGQVRTVGTRLILSAHDLEKRSPALLRHVAAMAGEDACAVAKVAWRARSVRDNIEAFDLLSERHKPMIALCMGQEGVLSRVLAPKFGAFLTFARAGGPGDAEGAAASALGAGTAAGQPTVRDLVQMYRVNSVRPSTRVYGVIGWPVSHSKSPQVHNAWLAQHTIDAVYVPIPVPPEYEHFKASVGTLLDYAPLHFSGASVTLPHKEHLVRFVRERGGTIDPLAERIGAANTLVVRQDGSLLAANTDAPAAVQSLRTALPEISGRRIAVLGAGGVARAVAAGLADAGAKVVVFNRSPQRAEELVEHLRAAPSSKNQVVAGRMEQLGCGCFHAFVNCTPVGMQGGPDPTGSAIPDDVHLDGTMAVMDTVYAPRDTPMLLEARSRGARVVDGWGMFVHQAALQFELWTNVKP